MTKTETPRDGDGAKLCAWCGSEIRQSGVGRSKDYCRRSCRQRAYEARKQREAIVSAVAAAVARRDSSRVDSRNPNGPSRDETRAVGDYLLAPPSTPQESPVPPEAWKAPAPRRPLSRNRSAVSAEAVPLWPEQEFRPGDANGE